MSKIITQPQEQLKEFFCSQFSIANGYTSYYTGGSCGFNTSDGSCGALGWSSGEGFDEENNRRTSLVDAVNIITPIEFFYGETTISWDEAWELATEEEKLILIQLMQFK
jgi:hypothetical protein